MQQMQIQGTEIQIKEYQGKRVVTLKDVDAVHQRKPGTASRNFNQNRNRFIEDIDFFRINVTDNEIRSQFGISPNAGGTVILITETGYLMLVKSFTDDLAWKVQRELVKMQRIPNVLPIFKTTRMLKNDLEFRVSLTRACVGTYKGVM